MKFLSPFSKHCLLIVSVVFFVAPAQATSLHSQIPSASIAEIEDTLKSDVDVEESNSSGDTAVLIAARNGRLDVLRLLHSYGADINALDSKKRDVLNIAITTKNPQLAKVALELGADPTLITSIYNGAAIIYGSAKGAVEIVEMLIQAGAPLNRINNIGWTALLEVAILGDGSNTYVDIATMLVAAGADKTIKDQDGKTAFDHAQARGQDALAIVLSY